METCYICGKQFKVLTTGHVREEHNMAWSEFQRGKEDKVFKEQIKVAKKERIEKEKEEKKWEGVLVNHWFSTNILTGVIKSFVDHLPTKEARLYKDAMPSIDLSPFVNLNKTSVEDVRVAEELTKIGWVVTDVRSPKGAKQPKKLYFLEKKG